MKVAAHGGDIQSYKEQFGREPLDFSANTNPLGMSPKAKKAIIAALAKADAYPDPFCRDLRKALAQHEGVLAEEILCGNGAADLIYRLVQTVKPKTALLIAPTFAEYEVALQQAGCDVKTHYLKEEDGFAVTQKLLKSIQPGVDMLFLCEPNNPTGLVTKPVILHDIVMRCKQTGTVLVVDECFNEFLPMPEVHTLKQYRQQLPNLVIIKAFTKVYGMAGVRLGYLISSDEELLRRIAQNGQYWPVSSLAQAGGQAALKDEEYLQKARKIIFAESWRMAVELERMGFTVYPSTANFLFFSSANKQLQQQLAAKGILIRDCSNYKGLGQGYYRIAVRTTKQNDLLLKALKEVGEK